MKLTSLLVVMVVFSLCWTGCADPQESIDEVPAEVGNKLKEGLTGGGEVVGMDQQNDPFVQ